MKKIEIPISGMHCASCVNNVEQYLKRVKGVQSVNVNLATEKAAIEYDPGLITVPEIVQAVNDSGYQAPLQKIELPVGGMHCASCVLNVEKALKASPGVVSANVNLATERAGISYFPDMTDPERIKNAVISAGYEVPEIQGHPEGPSLAPAASLEAQRDKYYSSLKNRVLFASAFSLPLFLGGMHMFLPFVPGWLHDPWLMLALAIPVQFFSGWLFYKGLWASIKRRNADMVTLVAVGTSAAFGFSLLATVFPGFFAQAGLKQAYYYDSSAVIITLILLGRMLEAGARGKTSQAIKRLIGLQAKTARVVKDGQET
ncbi:MAG: copper ion binding protein, partial [bacterium]|nr:copper ion binding protein [bacterium]